MQNHHPIHGLADRRLMRLCTSEQYAAIQARFRPGTFSFLNDLAADGSVIVTQLGHHYAVDRNGAVSHADPMLTFAADGRTIIAIS